MLYCANCKVSYPEGKRFCRTCGGTLVGVSEAPPSPPTGAVRQCPSCGAEVPARKKFCRACGASLEGAPPVSAVGPPARPPAATAAPAPTEVRAEPAAPARTKSLAIAGGIVLIVAVGAIAVYYTAHKDASSVSAPTAATPAQVGAEQTARALPGAPTPSAAGSALLSLGRQGNLVTPLGGSAYDEYLRMKQAGLSRDDFALLREQVLPLLTDWADKALQRWHDESNLSGEDWQNLQKVCAWTVELDPARTDFQARLAYARGQLAYLRGDHRSAGQQFHEAARLAPNWAMPVNALGRIAMATGKPSEAEGFYKQAVALEPDWVYPNMNLANHYMRGNRYDLALPYIERAAQLAPDKPTPHYRLGQVYQKLGRFPEAQAQLQATLDALERNPSADLNPAQIRAEIAALETKSAR